MSLAPFLIILLTKRSIHQNTVKAYEKDIRGFSHCFVRKKYGVANIEKVSLTI